MWAHCPGLIVVVPSNPADAKALFKTALRADDPVIFLEHKSLLSVKGPVPVGEHYISLRASQCGARRRGYYHCLLRPLAPPFAGGRRAIGRAKRLLRSDRPADDRPLDVETIVSSVAKTGRLLVVDEAHAMCGIGAELAAIVMEHAFDELDAPVGRLHTDPVSQPFSPVLEDAVTASVEKIVAAARSVIEGRPPIQRRAVVRRASPPRR